jgi:glycosyltransferase involved in cell wall biosynthesis
VSRVTVLTPSFPRYNSDYHGIFIKSLCDELVKYVNLEVLAPRTKTLKTTSLPYPVKRFPYMPSKRMEYIAEATMKNAPRIILAALPAYLASAYIHTVSVNSDLIHTHLAIPLGFLAAHNPRKTPQLITCHGSDITYPLEKLYYRAFTRKTLRKADRIATVSEYIKRLAIKQGAEPQKTETIYLGVDVDRFKPSKKSKSITIGTLGRLVPEKRIDTILYAAKMLQEKIDFKLRIGGDGPDQPRLMRLSNKLQLNAEFTGRVIDPVAFHQSLDVFVLASSREGLSISLQEAMACGVKPVAVKAHSTREIIEEGVNGYLFNPDSQGKMVEKIQQAINNREMALKAREKIRQQFNSKKATEKYLELYNELGIFFKR